MTDIIRFVPHGRTSLETESLPMQPLWLFSNLRRGTEEPGIRVARRILVNCKLQALSRSQGARQL